MMRWILWLALPIAVITYFARGYVVAFVKNGGDLLIANILGALVISILFRTIYHIMARSFYAQQDTKTPLYISVGTITLNIILAVIFTFAFGWGVFGLAWAQSIVAVVEVIVLFVILCRRMPGIFTRDFIQAAIKMVLASAGMGAITYATTQLLQLQSSDMSFMSTFPKFSMIVLVSFCVYVELSVLLKLREADPVLGRLYKLFFGRLRR